jgi:hypothetical protein
VDFALAVSCEAVSAVGAGYLLDHGWSATDIAGLLSLIGFAIALLWYVWWRSYEQYDLIKVKDRVVGDVEMEPLQRGSSD